MEIERAHVERALSIASWYGRRLGYDRELQADLDGAALEGLAKAAKNWDGERDFWRYAAKRIIGAMQDELRRADHLTRNQRRAADGEGKVDGLAYIRPAPPISTSRKIRTNAKGAANQELTLQDTIEERRSGLGDLENRDALLRALASLDERERAILLLVDIDGYTSQDVARAWGLSCGRVSQLRTRALGHLRAQFADCLLDAA